MYPWRKLACLETITDGGEQTYYNKQTTFLTVHAPAYVCLINLDILLNTKGHMKMFCIMYVQCS